MIRGGLLISAALIYLPSAAFAQAAESPSVAAENLDLQANDDSAPGEEILVTARRRAESSIDVPLSVTAVSGEQLEAANVSSLSDINLVSPAVQAQPIVGRQGVLTFQIRGMADAGGQITSDPAVGVYFAEAFQARPQGIASAFFDIQSVQVLKGPQGTLFGRNHTGGAVLVDPVAPKLGNLEGYVQGTYGSYDRREVQGAINVPLGDSVALRVGGNITRRDGFIRNLTTGTRLQSDHSNSFRASLRIEPSDDFDNTLIFDGYEADAQGGGFILDEVNPAVNIPVVNPAASRLAQLARRQQRGRLVTEDNLDAPASGSNYGVTNVTNIRLGDVNLKNIFNWRKTKGDFQNNDGLIEQILFIDDLTQARQISEEFQASGSAIGGVVDYIAGGYFFWERGRTFNSLSVLGNPPQKISSRATNESKSLFAQFDVHITPQLTLTAGGRYTWDDRNLYLNVIAPSGAQTVNEFLTKSFAEPTYTLGLSYKPTPDVNIYATTRRGYRSGGFNAGATTRAAALITVEPEILTDYEVGLKAKGSASGIRYRVAVDAFHSNFDDAQRQVAFLLGNPGIPTRVLANAGSARVNGAEFEGMISPISFLELNGAVAYTDANYVDYADPITGADLSNLPLSQVAKWTYRLGARAFAPTGNGGELEANVNYSHVGPRLVVEATALQPGYIQPAYGILNARVGWKNIGGAGVGLAVFGSNLTDAAVATQGTPFYGAPFGFTTVLYGEPRTYGVEASFRF